jgi:hypothetical protein
MRENAGSEMARRLRQGGVPLGELFSFMSGLYFRGKLAYARAFADAPADLLGARSSSLPVAVWWRRTPVLHWSDCGKFRQATWILPTRGTGYRSIVTRACLPKSQA